MLHVDHLRIDPAYRERLRACGLTSVGAVLARVAGRVAAWSRSTDTLHVPSPDGAPGFFLKRYYYPTWRKRFRTMFRGTFFELPRGQAEFLALQTMRALGVPAARPVAYGTRRVFHFVTACFLITEEVPEARNLTTFARDVAAGRQPLTRTQRLAAIDALARQVADMHAAGFSHGQLFWRNILTRFGPDGLLEFFFLDAQPTPRWRRLGSGADWWQRELSHLTVSALPFTTRSERLRFLLRYWGAERLNAEVKAAARDLMALARVQQPHETQRIKMNALFEQWQRQLEVEERLDGAPHPPPAPPLPAASTPLTTPEVGGHS